MSLQPYREIAMIIKMLVVCIIFSKQMQALFNSNQSEKKNVKVVDSLHIC